MSKFDQVVVSVIEHEGTLLRQRAINAGIDPDKDLRKFLSFETPLITSMAETQLEAEERDEQTLEDDIRS
jgi:hypothetical protein